MPRSNSQAAVLTLSPSHPVTHTLCAHPNERRIDRSALLDVAPDRESLLTSNKSIEELRQILKIRVGPSTGHWLYRNRHTTNTNMLSSTTRISTFNKGTKGGTDDSKFSSNGLHHVVRRVSSTSSMSPLSQSNPMFSFRNGFLMAPDEGLSLDIWGAPLLSTTDKLISPRPLGPTHMLLIHPASALCTSVSGSTALRHTKNHLVGFPKFAELPINDLLFLLNVPNLQSRVPALPRRLHKELPRVVMHVPHLETFPELVVYLHTQNQAELFRALIPEWIRDLMHPLPSLPTNTGSIVEGRRTSCWPMHLLGMLACGFRSTPSYYVALPSVSERGRTIDSISKEIAEATPYAANGRSSDPILHAACLLDALRDNLDYIGYYEKALWKELDSCREILVRAVSWKAKIDEYGQKE